VEAAAVEEVVITTITGAEAVEAVRETSAVLEEGLTLRTPEVPVQEQALE
jgi:hypothetical protein